MAELRAPAFNPCNLDNRDEIIPAKIWELLRRNTAFRADVTRLIELDNKERQYQKRIARSPKAGTRGKAWVAAWSLVDQIKHRHGFGAIALQWLVPDPLFMVTVVARPADNDGSQTKVQTLRKTLIGEGTNPRDMLNWRWFPSHSAANLSGRLISYGPDIHWTTSNDPRLRDWVNPIEEWNAYSWPFTLAHSWPEAPVGLNRAFQFLWRRRCDCRPKNPITGSQSDSPAPYESEFFHAWTCEEILKEKEAPGITSRAMTKTLAFEILAKDYRLFAIPRAILTKKTANEMGQWLATELKKGHRHYGDLVADGLLNETELLGTSVEWHDFLIYRRFRDAGQNEETARQNALLEHFRCHSADKRSKLDQRRANQSHFYRRLAYMESLADAIYPRFDLSTLLAAPPNRAHGKRPDRKGGEK